MYDKNLYKRDVTCSWPPPPVTNCHTFSDPLPSRAWRTLWTAPMLNKHRQDEQIIIRYKENNRPMVENKIRNYEVLVNLAKDAISFHFSGNECVYRKELFHMYHCIIKLSLKLVTLRALDRPSQTDSHSRARSPWTLRVDLHTVGSGVNPFLDMGVVNDVNPVQEIFDSNRKKIKIFRKNFSFSRQTFLFLLVLNSKNVKNSL